ncbi:MAG: sodium-independent anion transporter, partial [Novosphingobium sp.]|nr:sodium-independent anion transporter [Novosphingobium sp.]
PKVVILRMRLVPLLDASGVTMIEEFVAQARRAGTEIIFSSLQPQPKAMLARAGLSSTHEGLQFAPNFDAALALAEASVGNPPAPAPGE